MNDLTTIIEKILRFETTVPIGMCEKPEEAIAEIIRKKPEILCYVKAITWSRFGKMTSLLFTYMNQDVPIDRIYSPKNSEIEYLLLQKVICYEKRVLLVLPQTANLRWIMKCFMEKSVSFYPNLGSYSLVSSSMKNLNISYSVHEVTFTYRIGAAMLKKMELDVEKKVKELSKLLFPFDMPDYVKCFIAHNYLASTIEYYNNDHGSPLERSYVQSAYGALVKGRCVCQGYAEAYKRILNAVGIDCDLICGRILDTNEGWHAWNLIHVKQNTVHAHVDVTWDSHNMKVSTDYFGISDAAFEKKREWNRFYYSQCKSNSNLLLEAQRYCRMNKDRLLRDGLRKEWIGLIG